MLAYINEITASILSSLHVEHVLRTSFVEVSVHSLSEISSSIYVIKLKVTTVITVSEKRLQYRVVS